MSRTRYIFAMLATMLVASALIQVSPSLLPSVPRVHGTNISISLVGCNTPTGTCTKAGWFEGSAFDPIITVHQGDVITMTLTSADRATHQWVVDVDGSGGCSVSNPCSSLFSSSTSFTFTASMKPGTYNYACTIHPAMVAPSAFHVLAGPDFTISAGPSSVSTITNAAGFSNITVAPANGFTGTVTLTESVNSTNLVCMLGTTSIPNGSGKAELSCISSVPANYAVNVTGTSGSLSHLTSLKYSITGGGTVGGTINSGELPGLSAWLAVLFVTATCVCVGALYLLQRRPR